MAELEHASNIKRLLKTLAAPFSPVAPLAPATQDGGGGDGGGGDGGGGKGGGGKGGGGKGGGGLLKADDAETFMKPQVEMGLVT